MAHVKPGKPFSVLQFILDEGGRGLRRKYNQVEDVSPTSKELKEAINEGLLELGYATLIKKRHVERMEQHDVEMAAIADQKRIEAIRAKDAVWKGAKVGNPKQLFDFAVKAQIGAVVAIGDHGRCGGLEAIHGGAPAGFVVDGGYIALAVPADQGADVAERHGIGNALSWESSGQRVFLMRAGLYGRGNTPFGWKGYGCTLSASMHQGIEPIVPIDKPKWIVGPAKVKLVDGVLPTCPDSLAVKLLAASACGLPKAADEMILG